MYHQPKGEHVSGAARIRDLTIRSDNGAAELLGIVDHEVLNKREVLMTHIRGKVGDLRLITLFDGSEKTSDNGDVTSFIFGFHGPSAHDDALAALEKIAAMPEALEEELVAA